MLIKQCHNFHDFRRLAKVKLPSPIFNYIDGAQTMKLRIAGILEVLTIVILFQMCWPE